MHILVRRKNVSESRDEKPNRFLLKREFVTYLFASFALSCTKQRSQNRGDSCRFFPQL